MKIQELNDLAKKYSTTIVDDNGFVHPVITTSISYSYTNPNHLNISVRMDKVFIDDLAHNTEHAEEILKIITGLHSEP